MSNKKNKEYTLDRKKFLIFISVIVVIVACVIFFISLNKKIYINEATNISKLNADKYDEQILEEYNKDGMKEKFINDFNTLQNAVGLYIIDNSTMETSSFDGLISEVNKILLENNFDKLQSEKPSLWNGTWSVDNEGKLKFKFKNSKIEPNWINDDEIKNLVIKN